MNRKSPTATAHKNGRNRPKYTSCLEVIANGYCHRFHAVRGLIGKNKQRLSACRNRILANTLTALWSGSVVVWRRARPRRKCLQKLRGKIKPVRLLKNQTRTTDTTTKVLRRSHKRVVHTVTAHYVYVCVCVSCFLFYSALCFLFAPAVQRNN